MEWWKDSENWKEDFDAFGEFINEKSSASKMKLDSIHSTFPDSFREYLKGKID